MPKPAAKIFPAAYLVTVDMGYGHQRAIHPLRDIAACPVGCLCGRGHVITANNYAGIPRRDRARWEGSRRLYEAVSRLKGVPFVGQAVFDTMDYLQRIEPFYPRRDLSRPTLQVNSIYRLIKKGWGRHLVETLNEKPLPLVSSFFIPAFFAEEHSLCTDTDISRAWAPLEPRKSRINFLAPNRRVKERLMLYGVRPEKIYVTGFPLPKEALGGQNLSVLKQSLGCRIANLDPECCYRKKYEHTLNYYLGQSYRCLGARHPLTITFAVGGAGAQKDLGVTILKSLHRQIDKGEIRLNLVAGARNDVYRYYEDAVRELHLKKRHGGSVNIIYNGDKTQYFAEFNQAILTTDILWTKPSELSFYAGLGLPIIMAPTIGSQEEFNKNWLLAVGAGFEQEDPRYAHEWLFDWLRSGWLAEAAMKGFLDAPHSGVWHIADVVLGGRRSEIEGGHLL